MRLWSVHPRFLDSRGLVALWREGLLARSVLRGNTTGYRNHPQLERFRESGAPMKMINAYLSHVWKEAHGRDYSFDRSKIRYRPIEGKLTVTRGQLEFESEHLIRKLIKRCPGKVEAIENAVVPAPHPLFLVVEGPPETWERLK